MAILKEEKLMRGRYRQLSLLTIGANPDKLKAPPRVEIKVPVDWPGHSRWEANTAQVKALLFKAQQGGGCLQAQRANGDWVAFSILVNNFNSSAGEVRGVMDKICGLLLE